MGNLLVRLFGGLFFVALLLTSAHAEQIPATVVQGDYKPGSCISISGAYMGPVNVSSPAECQSWATSTYASIHNGSGLVAGTCSGWTPFASSSPNDSLNFDSTFYGLTTYNTCAVFTAIRFISGCASGSTFNSTTRICEKLACPDSSWTRDGETCTRSDCPSGTDRDASGQCVKDCTGKQGQATANNEYMFGMDKSKWQVGGCKVACDTALYGVSMDYSGTSADPQNPYISGEFILASRCKYTGASGSSAGDNGIAQSNPNPDNFRPPNKPDDCLAKGMGYIQGSNGITCVASSDAPEGQKPPKIEEKKPPKESGPPGPDGQPDPNAPGYKKEESESTTGPGGTTTKKTETVTVPPDGSGNVACPDGFTRVGTTNQCQKVTVTTEDTKSFCQQNPTAVACTGESDSKFSGNCDTGFACTGDQATCASAKATWELKCSMEKGDATSNFGKGLIDGNDPEGSSLPNSPGAVNPLNLSELPYQDTGGGSCPGDLVFSVFGRVMVVPMGGVCNFGHLLGLIGVALSLLASAFIIYGGIK
ncbi:MAG: hypothetical protein LBV49_07540 [Azonexus sp.]|jgi:hypothetical protein|nr:hypothetical protein [Azonexus sp.]